MVRFRIYWSSKFRRQSLVEFVVFLSDAYHIECPSPLGYDLYFKGSLLGNGSFKSLDIWSLFSKIKNGISMYFDYIGYS